MGPMSLLSSAAVERPLPLWDSSSVVTPNRSRRAIAVIGVLAALIFAVPRILTHTPYARLGVTLEWTEDGQARVERVVGPPSQGLLERGDVLLRIDGAPLDRQSYGRSPLPREEIRFEVRRGEELLEVSIPPARLTLWNRVRFLALPLAAMVAAPLVAFALVWRRPDLGTAWVFFWFAVLQAASLVHEIYRHPEVAPTGSFRTFMGLYGWIACWLPASFLHFVAVFPRPRWSPESRLRSVWFWLVVAAYLTPLWFVERLIRTGQMPEQPYRVFESVTLSLAVISLVDRYARPARGEWRPTRGQRALGLLVAAVFLLAALVGWLLKDPRAMTFLQHPVARVMVPMVGAAVLFSPFAIAWLIARDPAFDPRRLLEKSLPYAVLSGVLAGFYLFVVLMGQRLFAQVTGEEAIVFNVVAALLVAFAFAPLRERLQRVLDRLFGRDPRALRASLDQAGRELLGALDRDEVRASVESGITRGLGRRVPLEWPAAGPPRVVAPEELSDDARAGVESLLRQAGIRLENLALQEQRAAAERRAAESRESATRAELRALHAQVQPHFLFNALNALSYLTETDPKAAQRFTERLADMLRYTIEAGTRPSALLSDEIAFVEDYLGVARERYEGDLRFVYRGPDELLSTPVPPLMLQPLVENSLKHGLANGRQGIALALEAQREEGWFSVIFCDDGSSHGNGARGFGVGLDNLAQRLRRFAGAAATVSAARRAEGGYAVALRWPVGANGGAL